LAVTSWSALQLQVQRAAVAAPAQQQYKVVLQGTVYVTTPIVLRQHLTLMGQPLKTADDSIATIDCQGTPTAFIIRQQQAASHR
jgi:hypothetical protein